MIQRIQNTEAELSFCFFPLLQFSSSPPINPNRMPSRQPSNPNSNHRITLLILLIATSVSSIIILIAISYFLYHLYYTFLHRSRTSPFPYFKFSYKHLHSATNGFTPSNSIGKGGSATVFRGILKDGKLVAVKLLDSTSLQTEREFQNELQILGGLKSPFVVSLLGYCVEKRKRLVVYEYMPNKSLQESLFSDSNYLNWQRRFQTILDVAKALSYLHLECDPPVIHGDVKPSNVLLDSEFRAKLSDFGLSRLKLDGEFGVDLFSQELSGNLAVQTPGIRTPVESVSEIDFAQALQASSSSKNSRVCSNLNIIAGVNLNYEDNSNGRDLKKGKEVSGKENGGECWDSKYVVYDDEPCSIYHSKELNLSTSGLGVDNDSVCKKKWGKDWWWKQDGSNELCSKDYVTEWIGSQICSSPNSDWDDVIKNSAMNTNKEISTRTGKFEDSNEQQVEKNGEKENNCDKKQRKMQEWWKEEHLDELNKKSSRKLTTLEAKCKKSLKLPQLIFKRRMRKHSQPNQTETDPNMEFSFRKGWRRKKNCSIGSEMWSGDMFSRELSSTTSMRGTLCYIAPEYTGCGYLMEKADIYSFGVLILVILSGRRPLHVLSSPMKLEKANLISWCRQLAQSGDVLELIDEKLNDEYNKEQATLCINLALACLQKMPEFRPDIGDIVKILTGEMDLSTRAFEFSPSPPSKLYSKSRRKQKSNGVGE